MPVRFRPQTYNRYLLFIAGMGGLLYGIDVGIISAALLYLGKTISLTVFQTSTIVAAVLLGSTFSSLAGGFLADWFGRKRMMIVSGLLFVTSVCIIVLSQAFLPLLLGRILQGLSGGVIAVVVPLYLAETLAPADRGKGSAVFQLFLTIGIVVAALAGVFYTRQAEAAIAAANGNADLVRSIQSHAWRGMFLSVVYPGLIFFVGSFFLSESPRWLFGRGRRDAALAALQRSSTDEEAELQLREMETLKAEEPAKGKASGSLLQRKYVLPFVIACVVLICNQTTGINSILAYLSVILQQAGLSAQRATQGDLAVKVLNCVMTVVAVALVDRKGRKFLLMLGSGGVVIALTWCAFLFHSFESHRIDVHAQVQAQVENNALNIPISAATPSNADLSTGATLTVLYNYGGDDKMIATSTTVADPTIAITPDPGVTKPLVIHHAFYGPIPARRTGWLVTLGLALFIASFAAGPGVVVWLALSELMPTRIRSAGMGIALLLNQLASTLIAGLFLPVVGSHGYFAMFTFWALATVVYFLTAAFFLPETKGKSLEEIEQLFDHA